MDSSNSDSPRLNKWSSDSRDSHLQSPLHKRQQLHHTQSTNTNDEKEPENEQNTTNNNNNNENQRTEPNNKLLLMNDENQDTNIPFHLSHHHLASKTGASSPQSQNTVASSASSNVSSPYRDNERRRFRMAGSGNKYHTPNHYNIQHTRSTVHDHLQRKIQKLEQDLLSRNIQHDIMVNKEEMMAKRLKTKDIRIRNLQNDINKLRDQLTAKNEAQEKLINEMTELQQQNRGLNEKLRESNISSDDIERSDYNESMRDVLKHIHDDIRDIKQQNLQREQPMNEMERNDDDINVLHKIDEMNKNNMHIFMNKMTETNKNNENKMESMHKKNGNMMREYEIKMESMHRNNENMMKEYGIKMESMNNTQNEELLMNELKQEIKREILSSKIEINTEIEKIRNESNANIKQMSNNLKYEIKNALITKYDGFNDNNMNNNNALNEYQQLIRSQSDIINENALKLESLKQETKHLIESIKQDIASSHHKITQNSDENSTKTKNTILGLQPLFDKILSYFKQSDRNIIETVKENNNDMIQSFAQFKHEFQKIVESVLSQPPSIISSPSQPHKTINDASLILGEMKRMNTYLNTFKSGERTETSINSISENMQQMARRHDEIVKIMTATLPSSVDKLNNDNAKLSEICNSLTQTVANMKQSQSNISPLKHMHVYNGNDKTNEESVKLIKALIQSQIDEILKNMRLTFDGLLKEIKRGNVSMFNNIKQLNDNQQQHIVNQSDLNHKKAIKNHESVLKNHLQQIQQRLKDLNNAQNIMHKTFDINKTGDTNNERHKDIEIYNVINERLQQILVVTNGIKDNNDTDVIMGYIRNDMMKEMQLIKNLCNDIHKKSQQLPHFVARNKDLKMVQQSIEDINARQVEKEPMVVAVSSGDENRDVDMHLLSVLMMPFKIWCENILSQISNHRDNCSIYVIVYVLSQIAFGTYNGMGNDEKKGNDDDGLLGEIQTRALSMLDDIERRDNGDDDDVNMERQVIIEMLIEWIQSVLNVDNVDGIWISRTQQEMPHFCESQLKVNKAFIVIKNKMNEMMKKQSKTCLNVSFIQPLILCASSSIVVLFCLWLHSIQSQQNNYF